MKSASSPSVLEVVEWILEFTRSLQEKEVNPSCVPIRKKTFFPPLRRKIPYYQSRTEKEDSNNIAAILLRPQQEIPIKGAQESIDELSALNRQLFEDPRFVPVNNGGEFVLFVQESEEIPPEFGGLDLDAEEYIGNSTSLAKIITEKESLSTDLSWNKLRSLQRKIQTIEDSYSLTAPALEYYIADAFPDNPMEKTSPILLEPNQDIRVKIEIPEKEARAIILLSGEVILKEENRENFSLDKDHEIFEIDGPTSVEIFSSPDIEQDSLLAIGTPCLENGRIQTSMDCLARSISSLDFVNQDIASTEELEETFEKDSEEPSYYSQFGQTSSGILPDINDLGEEIPQSIDDQITLWKRETNEKISIEKWRIRKKLRKLDELLTLKIDSAYHGKGYIPPSPKWNMITEFESPSASKAASERLLYFEALHKAAKMIGNQAEAKEFRNRIRILNQQDKELVLKYSVKEYDNKSSALEKHKQKFISLLKSKQYIVALCPLCGLEFISAPTYQDYRDAYFLATDQQDRASSLMLLEKEPTKVQCPRKHPKAYWNRIGGEHYKILEKYDLNAVPPSILAKARTKKNTEDVLSSKIWVAFDRRRETVPAIYKYELSCKECENSFTVTIPKQNLKNVICPACNISTKNCKVKKRWSDLFFLSNYSEVSKQSFQDDSWWWKDRSQAFEKIYLKKSQWNTIYNQLRIQQERLRGHYLRTVDNRTSSQRRESWLNARNQAMEIMRDLFSDCETNKELSEFMFFATKQTIDSKTGEILERSLMDRVSPGDEFRIRIAIEKKKSSR